MDRYVCFGGQMAVVLADVVVVVKRCKEERTPCPPLYLSLYDRSSRFSPLYRYTHKYLLSVSLPPALPSSLSSAQQGQLSTYTTHQPSTHQTAYTYKRQTFTATYLKHSSPINTYLPAQSHTLLVFTPPKHQPPPLLPPISALSPKSSPEKPKQK